MHLTNALHLLYFGQLTARVDCPQYVVKYNFGKNLSVRKIEELGIENSLLGYRFPPTSACLTAKNINPGNVKMCL